MSLLDDPYPKEDEPEPADESMVIPDAPLVIKDEEPKLNKNELLVPDSGQDVEIKPKKDVNYGKKRRNTKKS